MNYKKTLIACYLGFVTQAIAANFAPLLFLTFHNNYNISLGKIALISSVFFTTQLIVDILCARFADTIGYRNCVVGSQLLSAVGLIGLAFLPQVTPDPFAGIIISTVLYAIGSGLTEVLVSPIVEACPFEHKEAAMSLLHSFYCWGHMGVVLLSTAFFALFGIENWKILALIWAAVPVINGLFFTKVPMFSLIEEGESGLSVKQLFKTKIFWLLMLMMACAGASEQAVSQWASTFAEQGLGVNKTVGDLAGPTAFAALMGFSRLIYGKYGDKLNLDKCMTASTVLCIASYIVIAFVPSPAVGLIGCAVCGFSVGIMWPGTFSKAAVSIKGGGTALFALLALAGDLGCSGGPTLAGLASSAAGGDLHKGIFAAVIFPTVLLAGLFLSKNTAKNELNK